MFQITALNLCILQALRIFGCEIISNKVIGDLIRLIVFKLSDKEYTIVLQPSREVVVSKQADEAERIANGNNE